MSGYKTPLSHTVTSGLNADPPEHPMFDRDVSKAIDSFDKGGGPMGDIGHREGSSEITSNYITGEKGSQGKFIYLC